jgi:hypothetical protein
MRRLALLLLVGSLLSCQTATDTFELGPTDANVGGTFALTTINGGILPVLARLTSVEEWDLAADTLRISNDSTWTETSFYNVTTLADGTVNKSQSIASGVYVVADKQINFTMRVGGTASFIGAVQGSTLTLVFNDNHFVYLR